MTTETTPKKEKPVLTCSTCGNPRGKNPSGLCRPCSARKNAENARAAKPKTPAPKTGAMKTLPSMSASQLCKAFQIQNCHNCDDLTCGDNMKKPAADTIHARSAADAFTPTPPDIYRRALRHYGDRNQIFKTAEEASELSAAIMRYMGASDLGLRSSPLLALVEELADVEIMCQQMRLVFGDQPIDAAKRQKIERLGRRLEE